jgi:hypothetical protein
MRRSKQLVAESAVVAGVLIMLTLGGSVVTTTIPPSFLTLQNPAKVQVQHDASALAAYYNSTLTQIGRSNFANASFLLMTFPFVNISPAVNGTAQAANADLAVVNSSSANATTSFKEARLDLSTNQLLNATILVNAGCVAARQANRSLVDFQGPQTDQFAAESIPTAQYSKGSSLASAEVASLLAACSLLVSRVPSGGTGGTSPGGTGGAPSGGTGGTGGTGVTPPGGSSSAFPVLLIGSPQTAVETGGTVSLEGNLTIKGVGIPGQEVLFFVNGTYFGRLETDTVGSVSGNLSIPFYYVHTVVMKALSAPNDTQKLPGATSNTLVFKLLFNQTAIAIGDPPAVLPTFRFSVHGNLTTVSRAGLPFAPVKITFLNQSQMVQTDKDGGFGTTLVVPATTTDGIYYVYASFAAQGVYGPSFNFTSIQVVHIPLALTLVAPSVSFAGFSTTLVGTARANGSAVSNADVTVSSPWGSVNTKTNSAGGFTVNIPISPLEFAFSKDVTAAVSAPQPYISSGAIVESLGLFNVLLVILPVAAVGIIGYEADRLGVFEGLRNRSGKKEALLEGPLTLPEPALAFSKAVEGPELLQIFRNALGLAQDRFTIEFRASQTIREIVAEVQAHEPGPGLAAFTEIMLTVEDFLYAEVFYLSRMDVAKKCLAELEGQWR